MALEARTQNLIFTLVGAIVVLAVLATLSGDVIDYVRWFGENLTSADFGTSTAASIAETIVDVLVILVLIGGAFFLVGFGLSALKGRKG